MHVAVKGEVVVRLCGRCWVASASVCCCQVWLYLTWREEQTWNKSWICWICLLTLRWSEEDILWRRCLLYMMTEGIHVVSAFNGEMPKPYPSWGAFMHVDKKINGFEWCHLSYQQLNVKIWRIKNNLGGAELEKSELKRQLPVPISSLRPSLL